MWVPVPDDISTTEYISRTDYKEPVTIGEIQTDSYGNITGYTFDAIEENLERANCEDIDLDGTLELSDFEAELTSMYAKMAESVNKYDGFYVGRFETSRNGTSPQSKRSSGTIYDETFIKTAYNSSTENDWYGLYALNKRYSTGSVQGSMIWGIQYDAMVTWMRDAKKSTISDFNRGGTCGTTPDDVLKNVYDIYGNCYEWTLEGNTLNEARVFCGIQVDQKDLYLGIRGMTDPMSVSEQSYYGSRLALYVM